ncbi:sugar-binding transcriptional regulator [Limimaricola pyoseonensis]|uniref:DNA-binding transcriptional regulator LsrR, DeoR family n=1 Tax=Limimaricola pyoseonensis TaxID=521013 RepID=A0A1G6ZKJ5_9RHOB|nr:sugar-binding transcriptional regulator [Limimaricola pyoseonensis]SDE02335.1 DNA-binding transcriptional regulator LsrR, DeoR family [Limimaricola pyoseonensis]
MSQSRFTPETTRLDDAARAGWLYYVAGNTQDEIAKKLGVSRQSAQRLVSLAVSEKLIKVRLDHPIARCMDLSGALRERFGLSLTEVVPTDPTAPELLTGMAIAAAAELERVLKSPEEKIVALGTGRALRACVEQLPRMDCPHHRIVSLLGNMTSDGSATPYNAVIRMAERVGARHYPYPLPVLVRDPDELQLMLRQEAVRNTLDLCARADLTLVGIGQLDPTAPMLLDGFIEADDLSRLVAEGAAGEITSWIYDSEGRVMECDHNSRVASAPLPRPPKRPVVGLAVGPAKVGAIRAALTGRLVNGLITDEATAEKLLRS